MKSKLGRCKTIVLSGYEAILVDVEAEIQNGIPDFKIIGLADSVVKESARRVKSAINNSGFEFPNRKITVNLAPAEIVKKGSHIDLAIAMSVLKATGQLREVETEKFIFLGELSLTGSLNTLRKMVPLIKNSEITNNMNLKNGFCIFMPKVTMEEEVIVCGENIIQCSNLNEVVESLTENIQRNRSDKKVISKEKSYKERINELASKLGVIYDQEEIKRAIYISLSGYHHIFMIGQPGVGKTTLANIYGDMMSDIKDEISNEIVSLYSYEDRLTEVVEKLNRPPIVSHSGNLTKRVLIGGGTGRVGLGLCSLAHGGLLFLDELDQITEKNLRLLASVLDERRIKILRNREEFVFPADFTLICASGPCKCGYYGNDRCRCTAREVYNLSNKFTGALMDRIDMHVRVERGNIQKMKNISNYEIRDIENIIKNIEEANERQYKRGEKNRNLKGDKILQVCDMDKSCLEFSKDLYEKMKLSSRGYEKMLKIARSIADFERADKVKIEHVAEAVQYRLN